MSTDPNNPNSPTQYDAQHSFPPAAQAYPPVGYAQPGVHGSVKPMKTTVLVLGICFLIVAALGTLLAFSMGLVMPAIMAQAAAQNPNAAALPASFGKVLAMFFGVFGGLLPLIAGVGLLMKASWGRIVAIVAAVPLLISIPFGTIFGGLVLFFLLRGGAREGYEQLNRPAGSAY